MMIHTMGDNAYSVTTQEWAIIEQWANVHQVRFVKIAFSTSSTFFTVVENHALFALRWL